jgi:hypothetical protein
VLELHLNAQLLVTDFNLLSVCPACEVAQELNLGPFRGLKADCVCCIALHKKEPLFTPEIDGVNDFDLWRLAESSVTPA